MALDSRSAQPEFLDAPRPAAAVWETLREEGISWEGQVLLKGSGSDVPALVVLTRARLLLFSNGEPALDVPRGWLRPEPKLLAGDQARISITPLGGLGQGAGTDQLTVQVHSGRGDAARLVGAATGRVVSPQEARGMAQSEAPTAWNPSAAAAIPMALPPLPDFGDDPDPSSKRRQWPPTELTAAAAPSAKSRGAAEPSIAIWVAANLEQETQPTHATHRTWPVAVTSPATEPHHRAHRGAVWGLRSLILAVLVGTGVYFGHDRLPDTTAFRLPAIVEERFGLNNERTPPDVSQEPSANVQAGANTGVEAPTPTENTSDGTNGPANQDTIATEGDAGEGGSSGEITPVNPGVGEYADTPTETVVEPQATEELIQVVPTEEPVIEPTAQPTEAATLEPTTQPTEAPTLEPKAEPTQAPAIEAPTLEPTAEPTEAPATEAPATKEPTAEPTVEPTQAPATEAPTLEPTAEPTEAPATEAPTLEPTTEPTQAPATEAPTLEPTTEPTQAPATEAPTLEPTAEPTAEPTVEPTQAPATEAPTLEPTAEPTSEPTQAPATVEPTAIATEAPATQTPTVPAPTAEPTLESQPPSVDPASPPEQEVANGAFRYAITGLSRGETIADLPELAAVQTGEWVVLTLNGQNWSDTNQIFDMSQFRLYADGQEVLLDVGNAWVGGLLNQTPAYGNTDAILWAPDESHPFTLTFLAPRGTESLVLTVGDQVIQLSGNVATPIGPADSTFEPSSWIDAQVVGVIDGETIVVEIDGVRQTVRYLGLDVPTGNDCFAEEATQANRALLDGQTVRLERQATDVDARGNWVRDVWVPSADGGYTLVSESLVASGAATAGISEPNTRFAGWLEGAEQVARNQDAGLWGACETDDSSTIPQPAQAKLPEGIETR